MGKRKEAAFQKLTSEENLDSSKLSEIIGKYMFTEKKPLRDDVVNMMNIKPGLKERGISAERITDKIYNFVSTFINGIVS